MTPKRTDSTFCFRCQKTDLKQFRKAAKRDGFGANLSAWILWHLRNAASKK